MCNTESVSQQKEPVVVPCVTVPLPSVASVQQVATEQSTSTASDTTPAARVKPTVLDQDRVEPITGIRKAMAKAMSHAQQVPHFGYDDEVRVGTLSCLCNKCFSRS